MHCDDREHKQNVTYFADSEGISSCFFSSNGDIHPDVNYPIYLLLISSKGEVWAVSRYFLPSCFTDAPICMSKQSLRSPSARMRNLHICNELLFFWDWFGYDENTECPLGSLKAYIFCFILCLVFQLHLDDIWDHRIGFCCVACSFSIQYSSEGNMLFSTLWSANVRGFTHVWCLRHVEIWMITSVLSKSPRRPMRETRAEDSDDEPLKPTSASVLLLTEFKISLK